MVTKVIINFSFVLPGPAAYQMNKDSVERQVAAKNLCPSVRIKLSKCNLFTISLVGIVCCLLECRLETRARAAPVTSCE